MCAAGRAVSRVSDVAKAKTSERVTIVATRISCRYAAAYGSMDWLTSQTSTSRRGRTTGRSRPSRTGSNAVRRAWTRVRRNEIRRPAGWPCWRRDGRVGQVTRASASQPCTRARSAGSRSANGTSAIASTRLGRRSGTAGSSASAGSLGGPARTAAGRRSQGGRHRSRPRPSGLAWRAPRRRQWSPDASARSFAVRSGRAVALPHRTPRRTPRRRWAGPPGGAPA